MKCGFNKEGFMEYLEKTFSGFDNPFLRETVENIIDYGLKNHNYSLDQASYFLSDIIPEIEFAEVVLFMDDSQLTAHGREVKQEALEAYNADEMDLYLNRESVKETGSLDGLMAAAKCRSEDIPNVFSQMESVSHNDSFPER